MSYQKINGNPIYKGDIRKEPDTGIVRFAGNLANTTRWTVGTLQKNPVSSNYLMKQTANTGVSKPYAAGTFMYMAANKYVIRRVTDTISGVSNTVMRSGAAFPADHGMHPNVHVRGSVLRALSWTVASTDLPAYTATVTTVEDTFSADNAAKPTITLAAPGELTYKNSKPYPVNDDYKSKTTG